MDKKIQQKDYTNLDKPVADQKQLSLDEGKSEADRLHKNRRYEDPGDAVKELYEGFNTWSAALASHSVHAAYALIAANWAVHGSADLILSNLCAKASLGIVTGFLGLNLFGVGLMTWLYKSRCLYADDDKVRWAVEFEQAKKKGSPWPYTSLTQSLGENLRLLRIIAPTLGGVLFILSLFF